MGGSKVAYETPPELFWQLHQEFRFTLDAAASHENALLPRYCTKEGTFVKTDYGALMVSESDGLSLSWQGERVYCNPPYDRSLSRWVAKGCAKEGPLVVMLLPVSTSTRWFHDYIWDATWQCPRPGVEVRFLRGRLAFRVEGAPKRNNRYDSMVVVVRGMVAPGA